jgi:hypothetical protein
MLPCHKGTLEAGRTRAPTHSFRPPRQSAPADTPRGALSRGIGPHGPPYVPWMTLPRRRAPVKPMCGTRLPPRVASATQDNPRPGCREPGPSPSEGGKQEAPGSARGPGYGNVDRGSASKPGASIVSQIRRESTPSLVQGLDVREDRDSPGGGRVTRRSGRPFIVAPSDDQRQRGEQRTERSRAAASRLAVWIGRVGDVRRAGDVPDRAAS